jgi:hypothetical protein
VPKASRGYKDPLAPKVLLGHRELLGLKGLKVFRVHKDFKEQLVLKELLGLKGFKVSKAHKDFKEQLVLKVLKVFKVLLATNMPPPVLLAKP